MKEKGVQRPESQCRKQYGRKNKEAKGASSDFCTELASQHSVPEELSNEDRARKNREVCRQMMPPQQRGVPVEESDDDERRKHAADGGCRKQAGQRTVDFVLKRC